MVGEERFACSYCHAFHIYLPAVCVCQHGAVGGPVRHIIGFSAPSTSLLEVVPPIHGPRRKTMDFGDRPT